MSLGRANVVVALVVGLVAGAVLGFGVGRATDDDPDADTDRNAEADAGSGAVESEDAAAAEDAASAESAALTPVESVEAFYDAVHMEDCETAINMVSEAALPSFAPTHEEAIAECQSEMGEDNYVGGDGGTFPVDPEYEDRYFVSAEVTSEDGDAVTVLVRYREDGTEEEEVQLVLEDGLWRIDRPGLVQFND